MLYHMAGKGSTQRWRSLIESIAQSRVPISMSSLQATEIDGFNAWEISMELASFTLKFVDQTIYDDRSTLFGKEDLNGFEMWRNLHVQFGGGGDIVAVGGFKNFLNYPSCTTEKTLLKHMSEWETAMNKYGGAMRQNPTELRILFIGTLPKDLQEKYLSKPSKYVTWQFIRQHISERLEVKRQYGISDALHKTPGRSPMHALAEPAADKDADVPPPPTMSKMAALEAKMERMQAAFNRQSPKGGGKGGGGKARGKGGGLKFNFRGCWECGEEGHSRHECPKWKSILDADGSPPHGHQGKKDKAYASWKANKAKAKAGAAPRKKVNALLGSQSDANSDYTEDEDDDDDSEYDARGDRIFAIMAGKGHGAPTTNTFQSLASDSDAEDEPVYRCTRTPSNGDKPSAGEMDFLNLFAHQVRKGRKLSQKARARAQIRDRSPAVAVTSSSDLNSNAVKDLMHALPKGKKALARLAKLCPTDAGELAEGEIWVMADTGSTLNGINVAEHLPGLKHLVRPATPGTTGAECANGGTLDIDGELEVAGTIDGNLHCIPFKDMQVSLPIASMRHAIDKGSRLLIQKGGGTLTHMKTNTVIKLHERMGVYFFKMRVFPAQQQKKYQGKPAKPMTGFSRPE